MDTFNNIQMVLKKDSKLGLTYGQILATITLLIAALGVITSVFLSWQDMNVRMKAVELKTEELERGRAYNASTIQMTRTENREDHNMINAKLDRILFEMRK
jgi:hypothetical protein